MTRRVLSAVLVLVFLGAQFVDLGHRARSLHEVCAEHGELVHASLPSAPLQAQPATCAGTGTRLSAQDKDSSESHEHCVLGAILRVSDHALTQSVCVHLAPPTPQPVQGASRELVVAVCSAGQASARGPPHVA